MYSNTMDKEQYRFDPLLNIKHEPELTIVDDTVEEAGNSFSDELELESIPNAIASNRKRKVNKILACDLCGRKYSSQGALTNHLKTHSGKLYTCDLCDFSTKYEANLVTHRNRMHLKDAKKFSCSHCGKVYNDQNNKNRHMRTSHPAIGQSGIAKFACHICPTLVTFNRRDNLSLHLRRIHGIPDSSETIQSRFQCDLCGGRNVTYVTKISLINHMKKEHMNQIRKRLKCAVCSKIFHVKENLERHLNSIHLKKFLCRYCNKVLGSRKTLAEHEARGKCQN